MKYVSFLLILVSIFACSSKKGKIEGKDKGVENTTPNLPTVKQEGLRMAYYALDSLKVNYNYYTEVEKSVKGKQERFQKEILRRQSSLEDYASTNMQRAKSGQLSENDQMMVQQEFQNRQAALYEYQQSEGSRLEEETFKAFDVVNKRVQAAGKDYCKKHQIDVLFIVGEGGQINYINPAMDATKEFVAYLNSYQMKIEKDLGKTKKKK